MSNPTTPFGWQMPEATDLVTDLPADFEVFGQAVATDLQYLLGGTTGQVLAKASGTDLDFVWSADAAGMTNPMTTTADVIYSSSGSTPARLGIGTANQVLAVNSGATAPEWQTISSGSMTLLSTTTLSGATVTISSISQSYKTLYAIITGVTNAGSTGLFRCAPNGSTNITSSLINYPSTTWENDINSYLRFTGDSTNGSLFSNANNSYALYIHNYTSTTAYKPFSVNGGYNNPGNQRATLTTGHIQTNTAISSLVFSNAGGNLSTGTVLLYGVN
jgi:hypothetical protein